MSDQVQRPHSAPGRQSRRSDSSLAKGQEDQLLQVQSALQYALSNDSAPLLLDFLVAYRRLEQVGVLFDSVARRRDEVVVVHYPFLSDSAACRPLP